MKRLLLTGATGFIGRHTIAPLRAAGYEIHSLGRTPTPGIRHHRIDLLTENPAALVAKIAPTHLLHLAWYAVPGKFWHAPENQAWLTASLALARAFTAAGGQRLVTTGSCAEYDWSHPQLDEAATPLAPSTPYGTAKAALFTTLTAANLPSYAHARIFFPYGPHEPSGRLLPDVIDAVRGGRPVAVSDGAQTRDFIHVTDVAAALVAILESPATGAINIAAGTAHPLRHIITAAATLAGDPGLIQWNARPRQPGEPETMAASTYRLTHEIGFTPRLTLAHGLADMVASRNIPPQKA